ncbi:MAG: hypothetical protein WBB30_08180 [Solirubrobacterales bacterium]
MSSLPAGLCERCRYQRVVANTRGSSFSFCRLSSENPAFPKYPQLPVTACPGFAEGTAPPPPAAIER